MFHLFNMMEQYNSGKLTELEKRGGKKPEYGILLIGRRALSALEIPNAVGLSFI